MKKFSFLSSVFLLVIVVTFLFIGCQKESAVTEEETVVTNSENITIKSSINGSGSWPGSINRDYAAALENNFKEKFNGRNQTLKVSFSAKDLISFITNLQKTNNSDIIYVNFGLYGKGAPAPDWKNNGRMTVFFSGNSKKTSGNVATNAEEDSKDAYLNHGGFIPPPNP